MADDSYERCAKVLGDCSRYITDIKTFVKEYGASAWQIRTCTRYHLARFAISTNEFILDKLRDDAIRSAPPREPAWASPPDAGDVWSPQYKEKMNAVFGDLGHPIKENPIFNNEKEAIMKAFEKRDFIYGKPAADVPDEEIFGMIAKLEADIKTLGQIHAKPKALMTKIDDMHEQIKALVFYVDNRPKK
jgi:hypothetical protein